MLGERQFQLLLDGKTFNWPFLLAAVQFPIIGVDFLRHYGLLVDPAGNRLVDRLTLQAFPGSPREHGDLVPVASSLQPLGQPPLRGGPSTPASSLHTGLFPLSPASSATCGTQVGASGSPRVKAPSGSRGVPLEAATVAGASLAGTGEVVSSPMVPSASCGGQAVASGAPRIKVPSGSRGAPLEAAAPASAVLAGLSTVPDVLNDFPDVVNVGKTLPVPSHDVQHHIRTSGPPIASRFRRLEGTKLEAARREFEEMERDGIVQRSTSPWASPLHMVPKKDGT